MDRWRRDWGRGGFGWWCTFSLSRVFCKISRGKYFAFHLSLFVSPYLSIPVPSFFSSRCFSLLQIKRHTGVYSRSSTRVALGIALDRGKKIGRKIVKNGKRERERKRDVTLLSSFERENDPSRRCFPPCRTTHVLSHASYN